MNAQRRHTGFTLIELLVVISIIAVLAAISAGAYFRIRSAQQEKLTGDKVTQLQKAMLQQWTAVLDKARKEPIPPIVLQYAQYDTDRAKALWAYMHLRVNFPETVAEATTNVTLGGQVLLQPNQKVSSMVSAASALSANDQAAVCAYAFLTTVNRGGMESGINDSMTGKVGNGQFQVFTDTFNMPITFRRLYHTDEMEFKPYTSVTVAGKRDPLDPAGKLQSMLTGLTAAQKAEVSLAIGSNRTLNGTNFIPTFISSGLNRTFDTDASGQPNGDDIFGYRLNVEGRTGN